jgi:hypothetical protein
MPIIEPPKHMRSLPVDPKRGHPVPYFVAWFKDKEECEPGTGEPDYRVIATHQRDQCHQRQQCWLCGQKLGRYHAYVIGPMCAVNRTTSEPASHLDCAQYAVKVCPFLSNPATRMMPEAKKLELHHQLVAPAGVMLERNPGVSAIWVSAGQAKTFAAPGGYLFELIEPNSVSWWCKGRPATRAEIVNSINGGLPTLIDMANRETKYGAPQALQKFINRMEKLLPSGPQQIMRVV